MQRITDRQRKQAGGISIHSSGAMPEISTHKRKVPGFLDNLLGRCATCSLIIIPPIIAVFKCAVSSSTNCKSFLSTIGKSCGVSEKMHPLRLSSVISADPNWSIVFQRQWKCLLLPWLLKNPLKWQPWLSWFLGSSWVPWSWSRVFKVFVGCSKQGRCYKIFLSLLKIGATSVTTASSRQSGEAKAWQLFV